MERCASESGLTHSNGRVPVHRGTLKSTLGRTQANPCFLMGPSPHAISRPSKQYQEEGRLPVLINQGRGFATMRDALEHQR